MMCTRTNTKARHYSLSNSLAGRLRQKGLQISKEYPQNVIRKSSSGNKGSSSNTPNLENSLSRKIRAIRRETPTISGHIESESCPAATIKKYLSVRFTSSSDTDKSNIEYSIEKAAAEYSKCQGEKRFQKTLPHHADDTSTKEPPPAEVVIQSIMIIDQKINIIFVNPIY